MKTYLKNRCALFAQPAFAWYFLSCALASFGQGLGYIATTWLVLSIHNSLTTLAIAFCCYWVPNALCSPLAGVMVDRWHRGKIIGFGDALCGLCYAALGVLLFFYKQQLSIYWLFIVWAAIGFLQGFYLPALMAFIRECVTEKDLLYANANTDFGYQIGTIVGMGLAGWFIHVFGFVVTYVVSGALLVFCGGVVLFIRPPYLNVNKSLAQTVNEKSMSVLVKIKLDFKQGLNYLISNRKVRVVYMVQLFFLLMFLTAPVLLAPFAKNILHANAAQFGHIEAALTVGTVVGSLLLTYLSEKIGFNPIALVSTILLAVGLLCFSAVTQMWQALVVYLVVGFSVGCWALLMTKAQSVTDLDYQGRVQSVFSALLAVSVVILYALVNFAGEWVGIRHVYWLVGLLSVIPIILLLRFPSYFSEDNKQKE